MRKVSVPLTWQSKKRHELYTPQSIRKISDLRAIERSPRERQFPVRPGAAHDVPCDGPPMAMSSDAAGVRLGLNDVRADAAVKVSIGIRRQ